VSLFDRRRWSRARFTQTCPRTCNRLRRRRPDLLLLSTPDWLLSPRDLPNPILRTVLASIGVIVLLPLGPTSLSARQGTPAAHARARKRWNKCTVPAHLVADVAAGTALTISTLNHGLLDWRHLQLAPLCQFHLWLESPWWRILMAAASLKTWFTTLIVVVQFTPPFRPDLLLPRQRYPRPYPPRPRYFLCLVPSRHFLH